MQVLRSVLVDPGQDRPHHRLRHSRGVLLPVLHGLEMLLWKTDTGMYHYVAI
ncbi:hypothetical protein DPMN_123103 [Dreissena polymorpha]|uniref:Uncharacterized protein n=1 Tax=Dreissena polymorpha TaxID=45954 RepID=A0A9D4GTP1_DREPO|nr:hypothetical protein DPMN_123103 [Dreissena polymorpha]